MPRAHGIHQVYSESPGMSGPMIAGIVSRARTFMRLRTIPDFRPTTCLAAMAMRVIGNGLADSPMLEAVVRNLQRGVPKGVLCAHWATPG